jgi:hypothetical protein
MEREVLEHSTSFDDLKNMVVAAEAPKIAPRIVTQTDLEKSNRKIQEANDLIEGMKNYCDAKALDAKSDNLALKKSLVRTQIISFTGLALSALLHIFSHPIRYALCTVNGQNTHQEQEHSGAYNFFCSKGVDEEDKKEYADYE